MTVLLLIVCVCLIAQVQSAPGENAPFAKGKLEDLDGFGSYITTCKDKKNGNCEYRRLLLHNQVRGRTPTLKDPLLGLIADLNVAKQENGNLTVSLKNLTSAITAPAELNGLSANLAKNKMAVVAVNGLVKEQIARSDRNRLKAEKSAVTLISETGTNLNRQIDAYRLSMEKYINRISQDMQRATLEQNKAVLASATSLNQSVSQVVGNAKRSISQTAQLVSQTAGVIDTTTGTLGERVGAVLNKSQKTLDTATEKSGNSETKLTANVDSRSGKVAASLDDAEDIATATIGTTAQSFGVAVSKSLQDQASVLKDTVRSFTDTESSATALVKSQTADILKNAHATLDDAEEFFATGAKKVDTAFSRTSKDSGAALTDSGDLVNKQIEFFKSAAGTNTETASLLHQQSQTALGETKNRLVSQVQSNIGATNAQLLEKSDTAAALQESLNNQATAKKQLGTGSAVDVNLAVQSNAVGVGQQLGMTSDAYNAYMQLMQGQAANKFGLQQNRLNDLVGTSQGGISDLAALLKTLGGQTGHKADDVGKSIGSMITDKQGNLQGLLADMQAGDKSKQTDFVRERTQGVGNVLATVQDSSSIIGSVLDAAEALLADPTLGVSDLGGFSRKDLANIRADIAALASSATGGNDKMDLSMQRQVADTLTSTAAYEAEVKRRTESDVLGNLLPGLRNDGSSLDSQWLQKNEDLQLIANEANSGIVSSRAKKDALVENLRVLAKQARSNAISLTGDTSRNVQQDLSAVHTTLQDTTVQTRDAVVSTLASSLDLQRTNLKNNVDTQTGVLGHVGDLVVSLLSQADHAKTLTLQDAQDQSQHDANLNAQYAKLRTLVQQLASQRKAQLTKVENRVHSELPNNFNHTMTRTFSEIHAQAANMSDFVKSQASALTRISAQQQLLVEDIIGQVREAMQLEQMRDEENMRSQMTSQLKHLDSSEADMNSTVKVAVSDAINKTAAQSAATAGTLSSNIDAVVGAASNVSAAQDAFAEGATWGLVGAASAVDSQFQDVHNATKAGAQNFKQVANKTATAQKNLADSADAEASRQTSDVATASSGAAELFERGVQENEARVIQSVSDLKKLYHDLKSMNSTVLEDIDNMLDAIKEAFGASFADSSLVNTGQAQRFVQVEDVVEIFGSLVSDFLDESSSSMMAIQNASGLLAENVNKQLNSLEIRVNEQTQWLSSAADKAGSSRGNALDDAIALRDAFKTNILKLDEDLQVMDIRMHTNVNSINDTIANNTRLLDHDTTDYLTYVSEWDHTKNLETVRKVVGSF